MKLKKLKLPVLASEELRFQEMCQILGGENFDPTQSPDDDPDRRCKSGCYEECKEGCAPGCKACAKEVVTTLFPE